MTPTRAAWFAPALVAGLASEWVAFGWDRPDRWIPDLLVGLVLVASGLYAGKGAGILLVAAGAAWFAGNLDPALWYAHRGFVIHLLLTYPAARPTRRVAWIAVGVGYLTAAVQPLWSSEPVAVGLATALAVAVHLTGTGRRRRVATQAALAFALVLCGGALARTFFPGGAAVVPAVLTYQAVLCGLAIALARDLRRRPGDEVTDLLVDLTETAPVRDALAGALGDPTLRIGYHLDGGYVDESGHPLSLTRDGTTFVELDGRPFAVILHDPAVLADPALVHAVAAATRLTAANAALQSEIRAQVAELSASRRRLLVAADDERRRLEERLHDGPVRRLRALHAVHPDLPHLRQTIDELHGLARGLHPRDLADGLPAALPVLAGLSPVPVRLSVTETRFPAEIEAAVYYVCAEALANVAKHAHATEATVRVESRHALLHVEITDDGVGGVGALRSLTDRVETFGGRLIVDSPPGHGTRLNAEFSL
ncbi:sensor histidine kinase [Nonomuraea sp. NPDC059194]|uniref:sensor histidine kinase n=1 Tax=Nonomuraea sp. NPDC059194 TaxID=3346764 RepID=UPI003685FD7A